MAPHSSTLAWKILWMEEPIGYNPWGQKESDMTEQLNTHQHTHTHVKYAQTSPSQNSAIRES